MSSGSKALTPVSTLSNPRNSVSAPATAVIPQSDSPPLPPIQVNTLKPPLVSPFSATDEDDDREHDYFTADETPNIPVGGLGLGMPVNDARRQGDLDYMTEDNGKTREVVERSETGNPVFSRDLAFEEPREATGKVEEKTPSPAIVMTPPLETGDKGSPTKSGLR